MPQNNRTRVAEFGGMMLYILIGVVLFGMLIYTYTKNSSGSSNLGSKGNTKVQAQAIIDYGDQMARGVEKLQMKGVSIDDISYKNDFMKSSAGSLWYTTDPAGCSTDTCRLFKPAGGNVIARNPIAGTPFPNFMIPLAWYGVPGMPMTVGASVQDLGTSADELLIMFWSLPQDVCKQINTMLNIPMTPDIVLMPNPLSPVIYGDDVSEASVKGKSAFCFRWSSWDPMFTYVRVLAIR